MAEGNEPVPGSGKAAETPSMFGEDGNFSENWTHTLSDTSLHDNQTLKSAKTVEALATMTVSAQKMVGADKVAILNEASSEVEIDAWHKAGGRPDTAADYGFARPEALPEEHYNQELATAAQELFHKLGISKKQADAIFEFNNNTVIAQLAKKVQDAELEVTTSKEGLYADWGNAYEQKKHDGDVAINKGTEGEKEGFKERFLNIPLADGTVLGNHPDFIRHNANLGKVYREANPAIATSIPTPTDIQTSIDNEMASKAYGIDYAKHGFTKAQHKTQVEKVAPNKLISIPD